jgi:4-alpha-glucanotransferase
MWAIFPLQDLLAINGEIRSNKTQDEQINIPSDPQHYWKYRMHIFIETLIDESDLNRTINLMVKNSGR